MLAARMLIAAVATFALGAPAHAASSAESDHKVLLAAKGKKKAPKKKAEEEETDFGPGDIAAEDRSNADSGSGVHREQEGVDKPYLIEASGLTAISMLTETAGDADPSKSTQISIGGELLMIIGHIEIGPSLGFDSNSYQTTESSTNATTGVTTTETVDAKTTAVTIGPVVKYNFRDIDHADLVPFVYGAFEYRTGDSTSGSKESVKTTGHQIRVGGGANFFLDSNVSFQPRAQYLMRTEKADTDGAKDDKTSGLQLIFGLGTFI